MEVAAPAEGLTETQWANLYSLISEHEGLFPEKPGRTALVAHDIELTSNVLVKLRPYRMALRQQEILKEEVERMLQLGIMEPCESAYASPMILVEVPDKDP